MVVLITPFVLDKNFSHASQIIIFGIGYALSKNQYLLDKLAKSNWKYLLLVITSAVTIYLPIYQGCYSIDTVYVAICSILIFVVAYLFKLNIKSKVFNSIAPSTGYILIFSYTIMKFIGNFFDNLNGLISSNILISGAIIFILSFLMYLVYKQLINIFKYLLVKIKSSNRALHNQ